MCDVRFNGVKVLLEHCKKEDPTKQRKSVIHFYVREWIEKVYVKVSEVVS